MTSAIAYGHIKNYQSSPVSYLRIINGILLLLVINSTIGYGQSGNEFLAINGNSLPGIGNGFVEDTSMVRDTSIVFGINEDDYEEILITLNVQRIGSLEIPAIIQGQVIYLPVKEIFDFLKIKNSLSPDLDSVSGFFINQKAIFLIDKPRNRIIYQNKIFYLKPKDLIRTENNLYLKSDYFGKVFGLECTFDFRSLSVTLNTKIELPAILEMQQELMRSNLHRLRGESKADTSIKRGFSWFHAGMADWSVITTQETKRSNNTRISLGMGAIIAGGEANVYLNYNSGQPLNQQKQYYRWRYVNNDNSALRQVTAGKIFAQATSSLYAPVTGIQFTNTPTTYRKSFGTYRLSNTTEPGWMVELYVNNVLLNYMKADASGFFTFEVPMVYGNSVVKLRFYSPWGEERMREQFITIPFNFLPVRQFEYTLTAGIVDDDQKSRFTRGNFNYGLGKRITIGGGMEYLSSVTSGSAMPFLNSSLRLSSNLLISAEHTYGVRTRGIISYRLPSNLQVDVNYTKYNKAQTAIRFNYLEERKVVISRPFRGSKFTAFSRLTINEFILQKGKITSAEFLLSGVIAGVSSNLTTYAVFNDPRPLVYSNLSLTFRFPKGIRITPQAQYEYRQKNFSSIKGEVEKILFNRGFLNLTYEKDLTYKSTSITMGFRYNFSFAQTSFSVRNNNHLTSTSQSARGSLIYNDHSNSIRVSNQNNVGQGGLIILPYLDINCNGLRDANEPKAFGLNVSINGGRIERNNKDTTIHVVGLEAYASYFVKLDKNSFENVAWQIKNQTIRVDIDPNHFKLIEVPVAVVGEVSGMVYFNGNEEKNGLGRIIVNFYNSDSKLVARTVTESDGFFSFMGLAPGTYIAQIDPAQLLKLNMTSSPINFSFTIKSNKDGDVVDGVQLVLHSNETRSK